MSETVEYECSECGWKYPVSGVFDGKHGKEGAEVPTPCEGVAEKITTEGDET